MITRDLILVFVLFHVVTEMMEVDVEIMIKSSLRPDQTFEENGRALRALIIFLDFLD